MFINIWIICGFRCPSNSQWRHRAKEMCKSHENYYCLYDENKVKYIEFCRNGPDFEAAGYKITVVGTLHGRPCTDYRYQPFKYWTNGTSDCVFEKSMCFDTGQVIFNNGTSRSDRSCRCDYSKGYDFIIKPKNKCFCVPSVEDCSCYLKQCPEDYFLTPDYDCIAPGAWSSQFVCPFIQGNEPRYGEKGGHVGLDMNYKKALTDLTGPRLHACIAVTLLVIILISTLSIAYFLERKYFKNLKCEEETHDSGQKELFSNEATPLDQEYHEDDLDEDENTDLAKETWKEKVKKFVVTEASEFVLTNIHEINCILITGPPGCGKSAIAYYTALELENNDGCMVITVNVNDIKRSIIKKDRKQVFILDDVLGKYSHGGYPRENWKEIFQSVKNAIETHATIKIIMTCRSDVYNFSPPGNHDLSYVHCDLLSSELRLSLLERQDILGRYLDPSTTSEIPNRVLMLYDFFPSLCAMFSERSVTCDLDFFQYPIGFVSAEINGLRENSSVSYLALAFLVILNNSVVMNFVDINDKNYNNYSIVLQDIFKESGYTQYPSMKLLFSALKSLEGTYVKIESSAFTFINEELFTLMVSCIGGSFVDTILKHGSMDFINNHLVLQLNSMEKSSEEKISHPAISVELKFENQYFKRILDDVKDGHIWTNFTNHQITKSEFRKLLMKHCQKHLQAKHLIDVKDKSTVIHVISYLGYADMLYHFLEFDTPDINKKNSDRKTALHIACNSRHQHIAEILLHKGANVNAKDLNLQTPLHIACSIGDCHLTNLLLTKKADINISDKFKSTPLHLACMGGDYSTVKLLIDKKAELNRKDSDGQKPVDIAIKSGKHDIVRMFPGRKLLSNEQNDYQREFLDKENKENTNTS